MEIMKEILKKYIGKCYDLEYVYIDYFNIDGANCDVKFYSEESHRSRETVNINIWDMVSFLINSEANNKENFFDPAGLAKAKKSFSGINIEEYLKEVKGGWDGI